MMKINIWIFTASVVAALIIGGAGATFFIKQYAAAADPHVFFKDCNPAKKKLFAVAYN